MIYSKSRLGRLTVEALPDSKIRVVTSNVIRFSVLSDMWELNSLYIDKSAMEVPPEYHGAGAITFERDETKTWNVRESHMTINAQECLRAL
jgi:hypothetical protein